MKPSYRKNLYSSSSFFPRSAKLWNSPTITPKLVSFKYNIHTFTSNLLNRYILHKFNLYSVIAFFLIVLKKALQFATYYKKSLFLKFYPSYLAVCLTFFCFFFKAILDPFYAY